jgi:uncharacterized protein
MEAQMTHPSHRVPEADLLRTFALFGIAVVNTPYIAAPWFAPPAVETSADVVAAYAGTSFFWAKFFVLFAFLFGWSMVQMDASAERDGRDAQVIWRRRMAALFAVGLAHAVFVFSYDILMLYAALGTFLAGSRHRSDAQLARRAVIGLGVGVLAYLLLGFGFAAGDGGPPPGVSVAGYTGSFLDATVNRLWDLIPGQIANLLYNGPLSYAAFCMGVVAARRKLLSPGSADWTRLKRLAPGLLLAGIALNAPIGVANALGDAAPDWLWLLGFALLAFGSPTLAAAYLVFVVEAGRRLRFPAVLAAEGKMSMTAYVVHGLLAGAIFHGWGLGLYEQTGAAATMAIAFGVALTCFTLCAVWTRFVGQGPLEALTRLIAYGRSPAPAR